MLRSALVILTVLAGAAGAFGQDLPNVPSMTCRQAQSLVQSRGKIVMRTSPTTFDRFVSEDRFCLPDDSAAPDFERTLDNPQCMIGYYCKPIETNDH